MRYSFATLAGAVAVTAVTLPQGFTKRDTLAPFTSRFETITLEEAQVSAENSLSKEVGTTSTDDVTSEAKEDDDDDEVTIMAEGCENPAVRVEWRRMTSNDRRAFVEAISCVMDLPSETSSAAQNRYEDLVWLHQQLTPQIHGAEVFLLWHRYYLHTFMLLLREECGYRAPFPWWDEVQDTGNFAGSGLFTDDYFGALPPITADGQGTCISNGEFGSRPLHIGPGSGSSERCLSRGENTEATGNVNQAFVDSCNSRSSFSDMANCSELGPHGHGHNGIGPIMADVSSSPGDPIFFMHHSFVDKMYKDWQNADRSRWTTVSGCASPGEPCPALTLDTILSSRNIRPDRTVREIIDTEGAFLCYRYDA